MTAVECPERAERVEGLYDINRSWQTNSMTTDQQRIVDDVAAQVRSTFEGEGSGHD